MASDLERYRERRDVETSGEPEGDGGSSGGAARFVVQAHDAQNLHYDFRLEVDGVLKSWAVPKGPSTDPREKRLAVPTEDHPIDYADFEGVIPEGHYGAGTVQLWDAGTYETIETDGEDEPVSMARALERGHATFRLSGEKLRGGYALIRTKRGEPRRNWLLVKMRDDDADARRNPVSTERRSVTSGRTLEEIARADDA